MRGMDGGLMDELTRAIAALETMKGDVVASLAKAKDGDSYLSGMKSAYVLALLTLRGIEAGYSEDETNHLRFTIDRVLNGGAK